MLFIRVIQITESSTSSYIEESEWSDNWNGRKGIVCGMANKLAKRPLNRWKRSERNGFFPSSPRRCSSKRYTTYYVLQLFRQVPPLSSTRNHPLLQDQSASAMALPRVVSSASLHTLVASLGIGISTVIGVSLALRSFSGSRRRGPTDPPKKSQVYTRTGDSGTSSLYNGERRLKYDPVFEALGHSDELNAVLGITREYCIRNGWTEFVERLEEIQSRLFDVGAAIATPVQKSSDEKLKYTEFHAIHTERVERWIDEMDAALPPLQHFVIPSGGILSTHINLARTICRRTERAVVPMIQSDEVSPEVGKYLNRLSDFLFVASRAAAAREGIKEVLWRKQVVPESSKPPE